MEPLIRKVSIGQDYKNNAMHYQVGQKVYGGHCISCITEDVNGSVLVFIVKEDFVILWKKFNSNMAVAIEYDMEYDASSI